MSSVEQIIEESRALSAAFACIRGTGDMGVAVSQVASILDSMPPPTNVVGYTTQAAMRFITNRPIEVPNIEPPNKPYDRYLFESIARGWIRWASQTNLDQALEQIQAVKKPPAEVSGALHLMALNPWRDAVEALLRRDAINARRLFWRASELGSQFGTESNPAVQWSFVASFFFSPASA